MSRPPTNKLILSYARAPGDAVVLTALLRDLKLHHGERLQLDVRTPHEAVFEHNPYRTRLPVRGTNMVELCARPFIRQSDRGTKIHFMRGLYESLRQRTGLSCPVTLPKPDLHFGADEKSPLDGRYWVLMAGGKKSNTIKHWSWKGYQVVADGLRARGFTVVQAGSANSTHQHARLHGVVDLVGRTNLREFINLIRDARGVICPVTVGMHVAAAVEKPCIVLAGGREAPWWEEYSNRWPGSFAEGDGKVRVEHRFLETLDQLDCCRGRGCWKKLVLGGGERGCHKPDYSDPQQALATCMAMLTPAAVLAAVDAYEGNPMTSQPIEEHPIIRLRAAPRITEPPPAANAPDVPLLDNPLFGGRITICTLLYGDHHALHKRLLDSLFRTVPASRLELRVGMNAVCQTSKDYLASQCPSGTVLRVYDHPNNDMKYPVMREMLRDGNPPAPYLVWFDDDSYVVQANWLSLLCETIVQHHPHNYRLYGIKFKHTVRTAGEAFWFRGQAGWWTGRYFVDDRGNEIPNGNKIEFVAGGFWAAHSETLLRADVPDVRLGMHGGDICIGEQIHQAGGRVKDFNRGKVYVHSSGAPPRGLSLPPEVKPLPWRG